MEKNKEEVKIIDFITTDCQQVEHRSIEHENLLTSTCAWDLIHYQPKDRMVVAAKS